MEAYDEDAEDPQYNLVFDAWDAQFDEDLREDWSPAGPGMRRRFEAALAHVNELGDRLGRVYSGEAELSEWRNRCFDSAILSGEAAIE